MKMLLRVVVKRKPAKWAWKACSEEKTTPILPGSRAKFPCLERRQRKAVMPRRAKIFLSKTWQERGHYAQKKAKFPCLKGRQRKGKCAKKSKIFPSKTRTGTKQLHPQDGKTSLSNKETMQENPERSESFQSKNVDKNEATTPKRRRNFPAWRGDREKQLSHEKIEICLPKKGGQKRVSKIRCHDENALSITD